MGGLFNLDNPVWRFIGKLVDVALLNLLWIICCIPIVTIGPATTAMYYVTLKLVRDEEGYIVRSFFHSFKQNLKQGMIIGIIMTLLAIFFVCDIYFYYQLKSTPGTFLMVFFFGIFLVYLLTLTYVFPILSRFDNSVKNTFINAFFMAIKHLPKSILMLITTVAILVITVFFFPPLILLGMALAAFLNSYLFVGIFDKYMPKDEEDREFSSLSEEELDDAEAVAQQPVLRMDMESTEPVIIREEDMDTIRAAAITAEDKDRIE